MADVVDPLVRSRMMAGIRAKNTKPEIFVRSGLHKRGFRYRLHVRDLPGRPDIVLPKWKAVIFVHGCFWHAHNCELFKLPSTRRSWWRDKLERNRFIDARSTSILVNSGWRVLTVYECAIKGRGRQHPEDLFDKIEAWLKSNKQTLGIRSKLSAQISRHKSQ